MQKKKVLTKAAGAAMMASTMAMLAGVPVFAAGSNYSATISGTKTTTFDKYLVMDADVNVPAVSFTYAVTAGSAKTYTVDGKSFSVLAGVDADKVTMAGVGSSTANTIAFASGDTTANDENALIKNYDNSTEKYAKKTATLDFSACAFKEPGVYRYVITESGTNAGVTNDTASTRIVDVYVEDASTSTDKVLKVAGYVLHNSVDDTMQADGQYPASVTKSQGFTNELASNDLTFKKEVAGNQASHDKYFKFTLNITKAAPGSIYAVSLTNADATVPSNVSTDDTYEGKTNPSTITIGDDGTVTQDFYLQHGQSITVKGLTKDATYAVTEVAEDYTSKPAAATGFTDAVNGTVGAADINTSYVNEKAGVIPTGVIMSVLPFAAVTLLGGFGAATIVMRKKKEIDE